MVPLSGDSLASESAARAAGSMLSAVHEEMEVKAGRSGGDTLTPPMKDRLSEDDMAPITPEGSVKPIQPVLVDAISGKPIPVLVHGLVDGVTVATAGCGTIPPGLMIR